MNNDFIPMSEDYRQKHYPNGYFNSVAKKSGGVALIICGAVLSLMGLAIGYMAFCFLLDVIHGETYDGAAGVIIFFFIIALIFLIPGVLLIRFGIKRKLMNAESWISKSAENSKYPESVIRDFDNQVISPDCIRLPQNIGFLTRDYIYFENLLSLCVIKRSDIIGAYLVSLSDTVNVGNKIKTVYNIYIAVFSNQNTHIINQIKQKYGEQLISMLTENNPDIDTANGRILSEKEYYNMEKDSNKK